MKINKIIVKNFKSLKKCEIELGEFNVLIDPNGSGKSNFIEVFELLKSIYIDNIQNPFLKWWGYDHVVWKRNEKLNISFEIDFSEQDYKFKFYTEFTGIGGKFSFIKEIITFEKILTISNFGDEIYIEYDNDYFNKILQLPKTYIDRFSKNKNKNLKQDLQKSYSIIMRNGSIFQNNIFNRLKKILNNRRLGAFGGDYTLLNIEMSFDFSNITSEDQRIILILPSINKTHLAEFYPQIINEIFQSPLLQRLNFELMKNPFRVSNDMEIKRDASNFGIVLYNLFLKENRVPDTINRFIYEIFPNYDLYFKPSTDERIFITLKSIENEFYPPSLSDGFFKILTFATIIELNPRLIIIDEIEDSLFARIIELFLSIVKENKIQLIVSTHSPYVVDIADPGDLLIFSNSTNLSTSIKKFEKPQSIKDELNRLKITLSEKWLYSSDSDLK